MSTPAYDYVRGTDCQGEGSVTLQPPRHPPHLSQTSPLARSPLTVQEQHYYDDVENEEPFLEPASKEDELKIQLQKLGVREISKDSFE